MHEKIYGIHKGHIEKFISRIREDLYAETVPLQAEYAVSREPVKFRDRRKLRYKKIGEGELWGHEWESAWFHMQGVVPKAWKGREIALHLNLSGESMLFDAQGVPVYAFSAGSAFDTLFVRERYVFPKTAEGGEHLDLWVEAAANLLFGVHLDTEPRPDTSRPYGHFEAYANSMRLALFNREVWQLLNDVKVLYRALCAIPENDYRAMKILHALNNAVCAYRDNAENAACARAELREILSHPAAASALHVYAVGHAHIDVGWLWPVRESIRKAARTFSNQLRLMELYPDYIFGASQPQLYQFVKDSYPELYAKIREQVKAGRWEPQGGMWVEADCNIISGESMVRQFLHGKNFFMDEFGFDVKNLWLPDVFGYSAAMPQIIRKSGCDFFLTQKLSWSQINTFPHNTFRWVGIDGSEVLTHFPPENNYNSNALPDGYAAAANRFRENGFLDKFLSLFGVGDGGGGPAPEHLEYIERQKNLEFTPKIACRRADAFFRDLEKDRSRLEKWVGELYLEFHRGTLTTQARTKRWNRKNEQLLSATEFLTSHLPLEKYPAAELDGNWKKLLLNQFHDIIPGSSIRLVYETTEKEHAEIARSCRKILTETAACLFRKCSGSLVLVNSLSGVWRGAVELPASWSACRVTDSSGNAVPTQEFNGHVYASVTLPGTSFTTLRKGAKCRKASAKAGGNTVLENDLIRYEFAADGTLLKAFDKEMRREVLSAPGNVLSLYHDRPNSYDAWDIDLYYTRELVETLHAGNPVRSLAGKVLSTLEFTYDFGKKSRLRQTVVLTHDSKRLDFMTEVEWHEAHRLLRVAFPVEIHAAEAAFDIQYGTLRRATHDNTSWDVAKFETAGQRYADLSDAHYGAALLNDCKYGYKVKEGVLDLALLRAPKYPDFDADMGHHEFTYSFLPHNGSLNESPVQAEAAALNRAPLLFDGCEADGAKPVCRLESEGLSLEVVKKAEKEASLIVRIVETKGEESEGVLILRDKHASLSQTNLIEWEEGLEMKGGNGGYRLKLKPFEIRTFRIR